MLYISRFEPDSRRFGEFLACLWQGDVPQDLVLHKWLYLDTTPRQMLLIWEGGEPGSAYVERAFGSFGKLGTERAAEDATEGLAAALARDLDRFGGWMTARGATEQEVRRALDVRRRGLEAETQEAAASAGREWTSGER